MQLLKPSIYNFVVNANESLILYNSRTGTKKVYLGNEREYIFSILNQTEIQESNDIINVLQKF